MANNRARVALHDLELLANRLAEHYRDDELGPYVEDLEEALEGVRAVAAHLPQPVRSSTPGGTP